MATDDESRRSTAAQFFKEEDAAASESMSPYDRVVDLLNQAALAQRDAQKITYLRQVQELIIHKDPTMLDNFLDEILAFQSDRSPDVKRFVIGFMEEASKKDPEALPKVLPSLNILLSDENVNVQKKVILVLVPMYKNTLQWLNKAKSPSPEMTASWEQIHNLKSRLYEMLDSENDGIRTHVVKFLESLALVLTKKSSDSEIPKKQDNDFSLDLVADGRHYLKLKKLEDQGCKTFETLIRFQASPHISSINLMTVMGALTNIAKQRPIFFDQVVQGFEALHVNLPPTLSKSQVSSVRKNLKMQMISLLKHPRSVDHLTQITTLLTDLGASQSEINKNMPKIEETRKRKQVEEPSTSTGSKKAKIEILDDDDKEDDDIGDTPWTDRSKETKPTGTQKQTAIDITAEDLLPRLTAQHVADLVLLSMVMLPDTMPAQFQSTYTPIAAAGTDTQVKHMARLLATQLTMAGMGKGLGELMKVAMETSSEDPGATPVQPTSPKHIIQTLVGGTVEQFDLEFKKPEMPVTAAVPARKGVIQQFKLASVTKPLEEDQLSEMTISTIQRIFNSDKIATLGNVPGARVKILSSLTAQFGGDLKSVMLQYVMDDLRSRMDLAFSWLYQEYANCQGFNVAMPVGEKPDMASYDECLTSLLQGIIEGPEHRDGLFGRLVLEAPIMTENAILILRRFCMDENRVVFGMETLKQLILMRPSHRLEFLDVLLDFTSNEIAEVRNTAVNLSKTLHQDVKLQAAIELYALDHLKKLLLPKPPPESQPKTLMMLKTEAVWNEESIKKHLYLYLGMLPNNHKLIHELANVYTATSADIKRSILRVLEVPVKGMGMQSPELLRLVENCPKGAETLVMRVIHILTDKAVPSPELVERIRDLYHKRVPDVRFLIPVLTGLNKKEVTAALPKLIKLNPMVVKEVFNRLMGGHSDSTATYTSPLTPAELLVSLHNIDPAKCDMKTIIKAANLCFAERSIYTQEVLAIVMQQLMEHNPLPTLLMRTVLQSLSMYPRLIGFVLNILQRLIKKQVWKQKKVWEGFVKCCQRTKPQSFQVLLQLPLPQLQNAFEISPELREPLLNHIQALTESQKAHIPAEMMKILETDLQEAQKKIEADKLLQEKLENEKLEKEKLEKQRLEREKNDQIRIERERLANEWLKKQEAEKRKLEKGQLEKERSHKEKLEKDKSDRKDKERHQKEHEREKTAKAELEKKEELRKQNEEEEMRRKEQQKKEEELRRKEQHRKEEELRRKEQEKKEAELKRKEREREAERKRKEQEREAAELRRQEQLKERAKSAEQLLVIKQEHSPGKLEVDEETHPEPSAVKQEMDVDMEHERVRQKVTPEKKVKTEMPMRTSARMERKKMEEVEANVQASEQVSAEAVAMDTSVNSDEEALEIAASTPEESGDTEETVEEDEGEGEAATKQTSSRGRGRSRGRGKGRGRGKSATRKSSRSKKS
ncbi:symplekin-like [Gigantopelta aegis]|uniref:symplekin-like n=1 Tax=Gigantopelta aegis TaxID=1735272 RepID=UPI001B88A713|nr:symplekin-like [Gigantopelta aegis]